VINVSEINRQLVEQHAALRTELANAAALIGDTDVRAIADLLASGIAALHERQGNLIPLMLQTNH
jgi:hypothetical protein